MITVVQAYYQGVLGHRDALRPFSRPIDSIFTIPVDKPKKREFKFFNRSAVLSALTSFQVGVFGFLIGYGIAGFETGFFGWLLGSSLGFLAGTLLTRA